MKTVVMWTGIGNNEQAWARILSEGGTRVHLFQRGLKEQQTFWFDGRADHVGPERSCARTRTVDSAFFSQPTAARWFAKTAWRVRSSPADILIAESNYAYFGLRLRDLNLVRRVVLLLSDHLPDADSWPITAHRRLIRRLHRHVARRADEVWGVSPRIPAMQWNKTRHVVPIYIDSALSAGDAERTEISYVGVPSADHALDVLVELAKKHSWRVNIIGDSPYLRAVAGSFPSCVTLHGVITDKKRISDILRRSFCGYAIYRNTSETGYSYYGVPSKSFYYLSNGLPTITTHAAHFSPTIQEFGLGRMVEPVSSEIEAAILDLQANCHAVRENIRRFRELWNARVVRFLRERAHGLIPGLGDLRG